MNAGVASPGTTISQLKVRWRVDADLREADRARLDGLIRELCDGPLEDELAQTPGGDQAEVCIRRVVVPTHRVRWGSADAELITGWAKAIGHAVRAAKIPGADVVRYASRASARTDLIVSVLTGDRDRIWAWQLLGLWPADSWPDAEAVSRTVASAVGEQPGALVAQVIAAARAGQLGRFIEYVGPDALTEFTRRAWLAAGGSMRQRSRSARQDGAAGVVLADQLVALLRQRSEIVAAALRAPAARPAASARPHAPGPGASAGSATTSGSAAISRSSVRPDPLSESLAVLAVLEVEPAMAAHPDAWAAVSAMAHGLLRAAAEERDPQPASPGVVRHSDHTPGEVTAEPGPSTPRPRPPRPGAPALRPDAEPDGAGAQPGLPTDGGAAPAPPSGGAATSWGGLLFLLSLVSDLGIPASVAAGPDDYGVGLRPVLHELGRQLLARAAPDAEPAAVHDPALLAFCGLNPGSEPPRPPERRARERVGTVADSVVAALRERLPGTASSHGGSVLLLNVCRRHAVIQADPGWIDVDLRLDEVSVDVRRAGLDLDPGYLPWLGCVVRFRYV